MMVNINPLSFADIEILKRDFGPLTFPHEFQIVYEGQIPCVAMALIEGFIEIVRDSKVELVISRGNLLGLNQIINSLPVKYGCRVRKNSEIVILGKSDIFNSNIILMTKSSNTI